MEDNRRIRTDEDGHHEHAVVGCVREELRCEWEIRGLDALRDAAFAELDGGQEQCEPVEQTGQCGDVHEPGHVSIGHGGSLDDSAYQVKTCERD